MSRKSKGTRLWLRPARNDRAATWVILDRGKEISTGCSESDHKGAEEALAGYIRGKHDPVKAIRQDDPNQILIADCISIYWTTHVNHPTKPLAKPEAIKLRLDNLLDYFGQDTVGEVNGHRQEQYALKRASEVAEKKDKLPFECMSAPRRELGDLSAAINLALKKAGGASVVFRSVLPDDADPRQRWITRDEMAKLIWAAWRLRTARNWRPYRHLARFLLVSIYTASRPGDVLNAAMIPTIGRGYIDVDNGTFQRKPIGKKRETNKRQPSVPLPPRLLAHIRRWHDKGICQRYLIEYLGEPVKGIKSGWAAIVEAAGLASDDPAERVLRHTMRHSAISWMLRAGVPISTVSDYAGVSEPVLRKVYKHHLPGAFNELTEAASRFGRTVKAR